MSASHAKAPIEFFANLEHEFWISGHPVRLWIAVGEYERHLRETRRETGKDSVPLACRPGDRFDCPTDHRRHERPHLGQAWAAPPVFSRRIDPCQHGPVF